VYEQQPDAGAGKTTLEATSRQAHGLPRRTQEPGSTRTTVKSQALHAGFGIPHQKPCDTSVSHLPLAYKRRRWSPSRGHRTGTGSLASTSTSTSPPILASFLNHSVGTWGLSLLSRLACSPPLQAPPVHRNTTHTRNLLDIWPHGRNQDKLVSLHFLAPTIERLIATHFTS
jgi:hypothetical protein